MYMLDTEEKYIVAGSANDFDDIEGVFARMKKACDVGELTTKQEAFAGLAIEELSQAGNA